MFDKMMRWIKNTILRLMGQNSTDLTISPEMESLIMLWARMYEGTPDWCIHGKTLKLPVSIASEFARLVVLEMQMEVKGGARAVFIQDQLAPFLVSLRNYVEYACALGGAVFKPYVSDQRVLIDVVQADSFFPVSFDTSRRLTSAVFAEQITRGNKIYTRLESHEFENGTETVKNRAYASSSSAALGNEISLESVPEWVDLQPDASISNLDRPLFAYFRIPLANNKERRSPLGVSVYANAVEAIRDADEQYGRLLWEYDGGQLAIDVAECAIRPNADGTKSIPKREERLYRRSINATDANFYHAFAPSLRDASYLAGLDDILRKVEFQSNLSFGTFSNPQTVEKTATEVKTSKQRSYAAVKEIQTALQSALDDLLYGVDKLAELYQLAPAGSYTAAYHWHDSVLEDEDAERERDRQDVRDGFMQKWEYRVKWYKEDEATAKAMVASAPTLEGIF